MKRLRFFSWLISLMNTEITAECIMNKNYFAARWRNKILQYYTEHLSKISRLVVILCLYFYPSICTIIFMNAMKLNVICCHCRKYNIQDILNVRSMYSFWKNMLLPIVNNAPNVWKNAPFSGKKKKFYLILANIEWMYNMSSGNSSGYTYCTDNVLSPITSNDIIP